MSSKDSGQKVSGTFTGKTTGTATVDESKQPEEQKKSFDSLLTKLQARGIRLVDFTSANEGRRKKMLQEDYQDIKNDAGWLYDEPIEVPSEVFAKEADLEKQKQEAFDAKLKK